MAERSIFETILASTVHDMKNSLGYLMAQLDEIGCTMQVEELPSFSRVKYEASRVNISLMELLTLYRFEKQQLAVQIVEVELVDFLEDCIATFSQYANNNQVELRLDCDDALIWFFDPGLVGIVINNVIGNGIRYSRSKILLQVRIKNDFLLINIEDDGEGYPESMLDESARYRKKIDLETGSTGLGLYFSATIATNHHRRDRSGSIQLNNDGILSGEVFS